MTNDNNFNGPDLHAPHVELGYKQILDTTGDYRWYSEHQPSLHMPVMYIG